MKNQYIRLLQSALFFPFIGRVEPGVAKKLKYSNIPNVTSDSLKTIHNCEMVGLLTASIASSTWLKHGSALKSFKKFEIFSEQNFQWPLSKECVRGYIFWAVSKTKLRPSTVQSYVASFSFIHKINDLDSKNCSDFVVKSLKRGAENLNFYREITVNSRKVMTLPLLKILGH